MCLSASERERVCVCVWFSVSLCIFECVCVCEHMLVCVCICMCLTTGGQHPVLQRNIDSMGQRVNPRGEGLWVSRRQLKNIRIDIKNT